MYNIVLLCQWGASTDLVAEKIREAASEQGIEVMVNAYPANELANIIDTADIVGKEIIIVADCMVMYATVNRMADYDDTHKIIGISGKSFNDETLSYLFEHIG